MAGEDLIYALPQELIGKASVLLTILEAVGIVVIIYIIFSIINSIIHGKRYKQIKQVNANLEEIKSLLRRNLNKKAI
jgi:uncharacterized membrane protein